MIQSTLVPSFHWETTRENDLWTFLSRSFIYLFLNGTADFLELNVIYEMRCLLLAML